MADLQLRLLPPAQPLVERLGRDFFRSIPPDPGIYRMYDQDERLIYVGKAKDLRARLASYRRTRNQSRKTVRLIHAARRIEWETCADEPTARLRENEWIRTRRPRFNRAGTWPRTARFMVMEECQGGFRLRLAADPMGECYGAFRAGAGLALAALGRLLWWAWHGTAEVRMLPHGLVAAEGLRSFDAIHALAPEWLGDLRRFLAGADDILIARLVEAVPEPMAGFDRLFLATQFERLADFFRLGPNRNRKLQTEFGVVTAALAAEELDDLLIRGGPFTAAPLFRPDADVT